MKNKILTCSIVLIWAIAPATLALAAVASTLTTRTALVETALNNSLPQKICTDNDGNKYGCP